MPFGDIDDVRLKRTLARELSALADEGATSPPRVLLDRAPATWAGVDVAPAPSRPLAAQQIYRRSCPSVVAIGKLYTCTRCGKHHANTASGFVVSSTGLIVTGRHVIDDDEREALGVMTFDGAVRPVLEVVAASRRDDLAVLRVAAGELVPLPFGAEPPVGAAVHVIGHPAGRLFTFTTGIVSRYATRAVTTKNAPSADENGPDGGSQFRLMTITAAFGRGSSGAPVLDERGAVVGVARQTKSIHHRASGDAPRRLQMVLYQCTPARAFQQLGLRTPATGSES